MCVFWQSITFDRFIIQAGADLSGVATSMVSMNSSVKMTFRNTATFFGVHVSSTPLNINYYQLSLATGNVSLNLCICNPYFFTLINRSLCTYKLFHALNISKIDTSIFVILYLKIRIYQMPRFYQSRKSERSIRVMVKGSHIPLYGGGASLSSMNGLPVEPVPLTLNVMVRSKAYVLGKLVKPKFYKKIECGLIMDPNKMGVPIPLINKCTYQL